MAALPPITVSPPPEWYDMLMTSSGPVLQSATARVCVQSGDGTTHILFHQLPQDVLLFLTSRAHNHLHDDYSPYENDNGAYSGPAFFFSDQQVNSETLCDIIHWLQAVAHSVTYNGRVSKVFDLINVPQALRIFSTADTLGLGCIMWAIDCCLCEELKRRPFSPTEFFTLFDFFQPFTPIGEQLVRCTAGWARQGWTTDYEEISRQASGRTQLRSLLEDVKDLDPSPSQYQTLCQKFLARLGKQAKLKTAKQAKGRLNSKHAAKRLNQTKEKQSEVSPAQREIGFNSKQTADIPDAPASEVSQRGSDATMGRNNS